MKYMGSKNRLAKEILPIILKDRKEGQWYIEPFCGGCNVIDKVDGNRIANDSHYFLIEMFKALQNGWIPPKEVNEIEYKHIQNHKDFYNPYLVGYVGFNLSYAGKWFGGYARSKRRNHSTEAYNSIIKQSQKIKDIIFYNLDYENISIPENSIIYCDPPYENTTKYKNKFNSKEFWDWVRTQCNIGHTVFVSEYNSPDDFECVWSKEINNQISKTNSTYKKSVEKLFKHKG